MSKDAKKTNDLLSNSNIDDNEPRAESTDESTEQNLQKPLDKGEMDEPNDSSEDAPRRFEPRYPQHPQGKRQQSSTQSSTPIVDKFGNDLTNAAKEGKLDHIEGRDMEIDRIAQILSRRKKNNPILIGEPGVGKSAIVEGLALKIVNHEVSRTLFDKRLKIGRASCRERV